MRVTVWGEYFQERTDPAVGAHYPAGIHSVIADGLRAHLDSAWEVATATLDEPEHGLPETVLTDTDVLVWWSHLRQDAVDDAVAARVQNRVLHGMGFVALHSSLEAKPFVRLMGTSCSAARWRRGAEREMIWNVLPSHPIAQGLPPVFLVPEEEMYSEYFDIPQPDALVFISSFAGGEIFRSGCCFLRGNGRIFYFRPGHETHPVYYQREVQQVIANAVRWARVETPSLDAYYAADVAAKQAPLDWFVSSTGSELSGAPRAKLT